MEKQENKKYAKIETKEEGLFLRKKFIEFFLDTRFTVEKDIIERTIIYIKKYKSFLWFKIPYKVTVSKALFFYEDWIFLEVRSEYFEEIKKLLEFFPMEITIKLIARDF